MERREHERQDRLGDPGARRQGLRERLKAVVPAQLVDERRERRPDTAHGGRIGEQRLVHAVGRANEPAGVIVLPPRGAGRRRAHMPPGQPPVPLHER